MQDEYEDGDLMYSGDPLFSGDLLYSGDLNIGNIDIVNFYLFIIQMVSE